MMMHLEIKRWNLAEFSDEQMLELAKELAQWLNERAAPQRHDGKSPLYIQLANPEPLVEEWAKDVGISPRMPEVIWLQVGEDLTTWTPDKIHDTDLPYSRVRPILWAPTES